MRTRGSTVGASLALATAALALVACGSATEPSPPTGVDELTIPLPTLDAVDFVDGIDNPWLPLAAGTVWTYNSSSLEGDALITVTVLDAPRDIGGIAATEVQEVVTDLAGEIVEESRDWFAQDREGNVWSLGEAVIEYDDAKPVTQQDWEAGVDGARAGLAMPAAPRIGDGYLEEYLAGREEDQATVLALDATTTVPAGEYDDLLETEDTTPLAPTLVQHTYYAHGIGMVREETVAGGDEVVVLVAFSRK